MRPGVARPRPSFILDVRSEAMSSRRRSRWRLAPLVGVAVIANLIFQAAMTSSWFDARLDLGPGANANVPLDVSLIEPTVLNPYVAPPSPAEQQQEIAK